MTMNNAEINEIIKAFAFGFNAELVAKECEISFNEAVKFEKNHAAEIKKKRGEIHE